MKDTMSFRGLRGPIMRLQCPTLWLTGWGLCLAFHGPFHCPGQGLHIPQMAGP